MEQNKNNEQRPLGVEIRETSNAIRNYVDAAMSTHLKVKLSGMEGMTMGCLFRHPDQEMTAGFIMKRFAVSKATMSQTLHALEKKRLIRLVPSKADRRNKIIVLTKKGKEANREFNETFSLVSRKIEESLTEEEKAQVRQILGKLRDSLAQDNGKDASAAGIKS